jgi:hypothetical protein
MEDDSRYVDVGLTQRSRGPKCACIVEVRALTV